MHERPNNEAYNENNKEKTLNLVKTKKVNEKTEHEKEEIMEKEIEVTGENKGRKEQHVIILDKERKGQGGENEKRNWREKILGA